MQNSRKIIVAAECLRLLEDARTKLAALEMSHESNIIEAVKQSLTREIGRLSGYYQPYRPEEQIIIG
jgi:hypothetical protein